MTQFPDNFHEVTFADLINAWSEGRRDDVVINLAKRHPAIAVNFLMFAAHNHGFSKLDGNTLANRLMDHLMAVRDQYGITATERHLVNSPVEF